MIETKVKYTGTIIKLNNVSGLIDRHGSDTIMFLATSMARGLEVGDKVEFKITKALGELEAINIHPLL